MADVVLFRYDRSNKAIRREMRRLYRKVFDKSMRRFQMRRFRRREKLGLTFVKNITIHDPKQ